MRRTAGERERDAREAEVAREWAEWASTVTPADSLRVDSLRAESFRTESIRAEGGSVFPETDEESVSVGDTDEESAGGW